jgi:hypothetical protein
MLSPPCVFLVVLFSAASACYLNTQPTDRRPSPSAVEPAPTPSDTSVARLTPTGRQQSFPAATEPGFTYCCGNADFKLEIECGIRLKRCYTRRPGGGWEHTFGRYCKQELGDACYMSACEQRC